MTTKTLSVDLEAFSSDGNSKKSVLRTRSETRHYLGIVDERSFTLGPLSTFVLDSLPGTTSVVVSSKYPVSLTITIGANPEVTLTNQTLFMTTAGVGAISVYNPGIQETTVKVIRLADSGDTLSYLIPRQLLTFTPLSRITSFGYTVTHLGNVEVQDMTLETLTNDQVTAPSLSAGQKFRICDQYGNPDIHGTHIMLLNDLVTQQNFSGTLQVWFSERS